jgi:hypothetical protein
LGSEVTGPGYNTFVYGLPGSGRTTLSREFLERKAAEQPVPDDWIYVNNFDNPHQPKALALPAGKGVCFRRDMDSLMAKCEIAIPRVFESEEFVKERDRLVAELKKEQEAEFIRLQKHVDKYNFTIGRTTFGFVLAPAVQGKMLTPEDIEALSPDQRAKLEQLQAKLGEAGYPQGRPHLRPLSETIHRGLAQEAPPVDCLTPDPHNVRSPIHLRSQSSYGARAVGGTPAPSAAGGGPASPAVGLVPSSSLAPQVHGQTGDFQPSPHPKKIGEAVLYGTVNAPTGEVGCAYPLRATQSRILVQVQKVRKPNGSAPPFSFPDPSQSSISGGPAISARAS